MEASKTIETKTTSRNLIKGQGIKCRISNLDQEVDRKKIATLTFKDKNSHKEDNHKFHANIPMKNFESM